MDKEDALVAYEPNRLQKHLEKNLTGRDIVLKYRQGGVSTYFVAKKFVQAIVETARIGIMAHETNTTQMLRRMAQTFWVNLPDGMRPERGLDNATTTTYKATQSEITIATAGNINTGRGGTYGGGFHGSEVAHWKDAGGIMAAILQGVPLNAPIALESSPNGAQGWFFEHCMEALTNPEESIWKLHFYAWWWDDEYCILLEPGEVVEYNEEEQALVSKHQLTPEQIKFRRFKQKELGRLFSQEYPEDPITCFLTSGGNVFNIDPLNHLHTGLEYNPEHTYVAGLDWGQDADYTAFSVSDATAYKEVELLRTNKKSWSSMRAEIIKLCQVWNVEKIIAERNSIGSVNIEDLWNDLEAANLDTVIEAFNTTNRSKDMLVKYMQRGLDEDDLQLLDIDYATHELRSFQTKQTPTGLWAYSHPPGGHDDTVIARMLANYACTQMF